MVFMGCLSSHREGERLREKVAEWFPWVSCLLSLLIRECEGETERDRWLLNIHYASVV